MCDLILEILFIWVQCTFIDTGIYILDSDAGKIFLKDGDIYGL